MPYTPFPFNRADSYSSSHHTSPHNHYVHLSERDQALQQLQQMLHTLQTVLKIQLLYLPKHFPEFYLQERNPLVLLVHFRHIIKHHHTPNLHTLHQLNHRLRWLRSPVSHRVLMNKINQLGRRVLHDHAEITHFLCALAAVKPHNGSYRLARRPQPSAQQVVTDFFYRRMQHHDVMQRRAAQIRFNFKHEQCSAEPPHISVCLDPYSRESQYALQRSPQRVIY
jgi:hypothetical protein